MRYLGGDSAKWFSQEIWYIQSRVNSRVDETYGGATKLHGLFGDAAVPYCSQ